MQRLIADSIISRHAEPPKENIWQWCAKHVDYSLVPNYEIPREFLGPFDPDYAPFWKEPVECLGMDGEFGDIREIVILKPSRSICTEHVVVNPLRYFCATGSHQLYYLGGQGEMVERFFEERLERGLRCCVDLKRMEWRRVGTRLMTNLWQLTASYPGSKSSDKQAGYEIIFVDEASLCPPDQIASLRQRMVSYRYTGKMVILSSPDAKQKKPSDEDAIFIEHAGLQEDGRETADKREWFCPDPKTGKPFQFRLGEVDSVDGLKWSKDALDEQGNWNMVRVAETVHFVTPDGTVIRNADKMKIVRHGHWKPTNDKATDKTRRTYHLDAICLPFLSGDFDKYAVEFLRAVKRGQDALRVFKYEFQAEKFYGEKQVIEDDTILQRAAKYKRGQRVSQVSEYAPLYIGKQLWVAGAIDVQQESLFYGLREFVDGGDSGLIDLAEVQKWESVKEAMIKHSCGGVLIDNSYAERRHEVIQQCLNGVMKGAIPCYGRDSLQVPFKAQIGDPYYGNQQRAGRYQLFMCTFNPDQIKSLLFREISNIGGHTWRIPEDMDGKYVRGMRSEECVDGAWVRKDRYNHPWDVEVLLLLCAMLKENGRGECLFRQVGIMGIMQAGNVQEPQEPKEEKKQVTLAKKIVSQDNRSQAEKDFYEKQGQEQSDNGEFSLPEGTELQRRPGDDW